MKWNQSSVFSESATMDTKYRYLYEDYNPSDQRSSLGKSKTMSQCRKEYSCMR